MSPVAIVLVVLIGLQPRPLGAVPGTSRVEANARSSSSDARAPVGGVEATMRLSSSDTPAPAGDVEANIGRGDALTRSGDFAGAAEAYASAWALLGGEDRVGPLGRLLVQKATDAYRTAATRAPSDRRLLDAPQALLDRFFQEAREAGQPDDLALLDELRRLERRLERTAPRETSQDSAGRGAAETETETGPRPSSSADDASERASPQASDRVSEPKHSAPRDAAGSAASSNRPIPPPRVNSANFARDPGLTPGELPPGPRTPSRSRQAGIALVSVGAASVITGAILLGLGIATQNAVPSRRAKRLASPEFQSLSPDQQQDYARRYDAYVETSQQVARWRMGLGGAALGVGVTAVVLGAVLWAGRRRKGAHSTEVPR